MESINQAAFEYTDGQGRTFRIGVSKDVSDSIQRLIDRIDPTPVVMVVALGLTVSIGTNPEFRRNAAEVCSKWLNAGLRAVHTRSIETT